MVLGSQVLTEDCGREGKGETGSGSTTSAQPTYLHHMATLGRLGHQATRLLQGRHCYTPRLTRQQITEIINAVSQDPF